MVMVMVMPMVVKVEPVLKESTLVKSIMCLNY